MEPALETAYKKLLSIREREDLTLKPTPLLRKTIKTLDGTEKPLKPRYYQVQMVLHLLAMKRFIVGDDTGLGKCVTRDTLVETNRGLVPIGNLQPSPDMKPDTFEPVEGWEVRVGEEYVPVSSFYYNGRKPTRKVRTRYGFEIEGSRVHPLLVRGQEGQEWRQTQNIEAGDFLCVDRSGGFPDVEPPLAVPQVGEDTGANAKTYPVPDQLNPPLARLLGYIVGEAWVNNPHTFSISQCPVKNPDAYRDIHNLLLEQFGWSSEAEQKDTFIHSKFLRTYLEHMGVDYTLSADKTVPAPVLRGTRDSNREFLRGLFEGEGSAITTGGIEFSTASETLGKQIQIMLLRFGIVANRSPKTVKGRDHTYWRLTLFGDDARRFADEVGFVSARKQERLAGVLPESSNPNHDVVPFAKPLVESLRESITERCKAGNLKLSTHWGSAFYNTLGHIRQGRRNPTYGFLQTLLSVATELGIDDTWPAFQAVQTVVSQKFFYDPVVEVVDGFKEVMDISVPGPHQFVGNGLVNHNTFETIAALCYLWQMNPNQKVIVLTKKSAVPQWVKEFAKFTTGVKTVMVKGSPKKRQKLYDEWEESEGPTAMIAGYSSLKRDIARVQDWEDYILVCDEATVFKNPKTQVHQVCKHMAQQADRVWGLTATLIKNNLIEGFGIYKVVVPSLFGHTQNAFMRDYCLIRMQRVRGNRQVPVIVGYRQSDIERFKLKIDPYYLGRPKHEVAKELPVLTTKDIEVGMTRFQHEKYQEALAGLLELGSGEEKETDKLTSIIYCQQIANHPALIEYEDSKSDKLDTLVDMLTDGGDFESQKVIIFTRFKKMVDYAIPVLEKKGVKCVRVTGDEDEDERAEAMEIFQNPESDTNVIWITMAGGDAINLQMAKALIFFDTPWSAGDYLQILGRMIRIGSPNDRVYAVHLIAEGTVDERVQEVLKKKMSLVEAILGKRLVGEGDEGEDTTFEVEGDITKLFNALREDAQKILSVK